MHLVKAGIAVALKVILTSLCLVGHRKILYSTFQVEDMSYDVKDTVYSDPS
jgi:hypothetical protein